MKKLMALLLTLVTVLSMTCVAFAGEMPTTSNIYPAEYEYFDDGSYILTIITEESTLPLARATSSKTASKTVTYSKNGTSLWYVKVTGTFSYNGTSSSCTNSSVTAGSYSNSWKITNTSHSKSGATAKASATAKLYANNIAINTVTKNATLTCDKNGKCS